MPRTTDVLVAFVAAHGNHAITKGVPLPLDRLSAMSGSAFRLAGDECEGTDRFFVVDATRRVAGKPIADTVGLLLVARRAAADAVYRVETQFPPRTLLKNEDALAFVERCPEREGIRRRLVELLQAASWDDLVQRARASTEKEIVDRMSTALAATSFTDETRTAWRDFESAHRNPDFRPMFALRHVVTREALPIYANREEARRALARALDGLASFCRSSALASWADVFEEARGRLDATSREGVAYTHLGGSGLEDASLQLLDAAWSADVLGGMGSFGDAAPPSAASQALAAALPPAVEAALNA
jgi:hypothetical protein